MAARKTALDMAAYTLDGNDHLGTLRVFGMQSSATLVPSQGQADTDAFNQETKRKFTHNFELLIDDSGPKMTNLTLSVWTPSGSSLLGDVRSGSLSMKIPTADGSGAVDGFTWANIVGARDIMIDASMFIPAAASAVDLLTKAISGTLADRINATTLLTFGTGFAFSMPSVMGDVDFASEFEAIQTYSAKFAQQGALLAAPSGSSLYGVAFAGDGLITLAADVGHGTWGGTGCISSLDLKFSDSQLHTVSGTIELQGAPTYA